MKVDKSIGRLFSSNLLTLVRRSEIKFLQLSSSGIRSRMARAKS